LKIII